MGREIERKFLVRNDNWRAEAGHGVPYRQGYLSTEPKHSVRVRIAAERAFLTIKGPSSGAARDEFEYPIPVGDAAELLDRLCVQPLIEKTRYVVHHAGLKWEIDEFRGANQGLIVAELELKTADQEFAKPDWAAEEVTGDPRYYNLHLVKHPYSEWGKRKEPGGGVSAEVE